MPNIPSRKNMLSRIRNNNNALLEFDPHTGGLKVKAW